MDGGARAARTILAIAVTLVAAAPAVAQALPPIPSKLETLIPGPRAPTRGPISLPGPGFLSGQPELGLRDTVVKHGSRSTAGVEVAAAAQFPTPDGYSITVRWGDSSPYGPADAEEIVDFLSTLLHGNEMRALSVFLATPSELSAICGDEALACYYSLDEEMIVAGDPGSAAGLTREYVIAHEYGHHVAANRNNAPFPAFVFGPKYWATQQHVCQGVISGRYKPAGEYFRRPGEAWAETYAFYHYPHDTSWDWLFPHPDAASYRALVRDTMHPWQRPVRGRENNRVDIYDPIDAWLIRTPLDGRLKLKLRAHRHADLDLYVFARKKPVLLAASVGGRRTKRISGIICGRSGVRVLVVATDPGGSSYTLSGSRP